MPEPVPSGGGWREALFNRRMLICVFTGFSSGLPLYILLLAIAPVLVVIVRRDYRIALLFSTTVYLLAWKFSWNLSADKYGREWYLNPFTWQLLYTIGTALAHLSRTAPKKNIMGAPMAVRGGGVSDRYRDYRVAIEPA